MQQLGQFITTHWPLWLALIIITLLILINEIISQKKKAKSLSPQAAVDRMNQEEAVVLDIRDKESFKEGHIINAKNVSAEEFKLPRLEKFKTQPFILVCQRGIQSEALATKLKDQGFQNAMTLSGGMAAWVAANLPTVKHKNRKSQ